MYPRLPACRFPRLVPTILSSYLSCISLLIFDHFPLPCLVSVPLSTAKEIRDPRRQTHSSQEVQTYQCNGRNHQQRRWWRSVKTKSLAKSWTAQAKVSAVMWWSSKIHVIWYIHLSLGKKTNVLSMLLAQDSEHTISKYLLQVIWACP